MQEFLGDYDKERILTLVTQESDSEIEDGVALVRKLVKKASKDERTMQPLSKVIGNGSQAQSSPGWKNMGRL